MRFEEGMYIKCTLQNSVGDFLTAAVQIDAIKKNEIVVLGYEKKGSGLVTRRFKVDADNASRVFLKIGSDVVINGEPGRIIAKSKKRSSKWHYVYWCKVKNKICAISEDNIQISFEDYEKNPKDLFLYEHECSLNDYFARYEVNTYLDKVNSITGGYEDALDKKIDLYAHQIETVQKVLSCRPYRAILADEVGLGKTIEALVVLDYLLKRSVCKNAIIVVPDQLLYQWQNEAKEKFGLNVAVFTYASFVKKGEKPQVLLVGFDNYVRYADEFILEKEWGLAIIDEVHKTLKEKRLYTQLFKLTRKVQNHLLLSATPIMKRNEEYYRLLRLLYPEVYQEISLEKFLDIMAKREGLEKELANIVSDIHYAFDDDVLAEYIDRLKSIAENINDFKLKDYLTKVDYDNYTELRNTVKRAVLYLQKAYEIESKFIRHRRSEILDDSSKRVLSNKKGFYLKGEDRLSGEDGLYQCFTEEIQHIREQGLVDGEQLINLVNAFFSSASALNSELIANDLYEVFPKTNKKSYFESIEEKKTLSNSRIEGLISLLKEYRSDKKIIIFSDYAESVKLIHKRLTMEFGERKIVLFTGAESEARMQISVNNFVSNNEARFMVCDKYGAEGRNFQFADVIIHYDLPWSPARLEQRIGRLDRIGRKPGKQVYNDVLYVRDTVEEDLFTLYNECLDIFNESLCGIEIIFDELWCAIKNTIEERGLFGFSYVFDLVSELKEKCSQVLFEEMLDLECLEDNSSSVNSAKQMMDMFSNSEKKRFYDAVLRWHFEAGYGNKLSTEIEGDCYRIPAKVRDEKCAKKRKYSPQLNSDLLVTYNLEKSDTYENMTMLTLNHPLVKAILKSVNSTNVGKNIAISVDSSEIQWKGFIVTWKVEFLEFDNMGKLWSRVNCAIRNDYLNKTRLSIPYSLNNTTLLADEIFEIIKNSETDLLSINEICEALDYADVESCLCNAIKATKEDFIELLKNEIDYEALENKIEVLREERDVNHMIGRLTSSATKLLDIHEAVKRMLENFEVEVESIMFVSIGKE